MAGLSAALLLVAVALLATETNGVVYGVSHYNGPFHLPPPNPAVRHKRAVPPQFVMQYPSGITCVDQPCAPSADVLLAPKRRTFWSMC